MCEYLNQATSAVACVHGEDNSLVCAGFKDDSVRSSGKLLVGKVSLILSLKIGNSKSVTVFPYSSSWTSILAHQFWRNLSDNQNLDLPGA